MEIYVQKLDSQIPLDEERVLQLLEMGELSTGDLSRVDKLHEWTPLWSLSGIPPLVKEIYVFEMFRKVVELNKQIWLRCKDNLLLRKRFEDKLDEWEEAVISFNKKFPNHPVGRSGEVFLYFNQANLKIENNAFMAFPPDHDRIIDAIIALQNENAAEAVSLFDKAISLDNQARFHILKVQPLLHLRQFLEALEEIEYVLEHFADDEEYFNEALRLQSVTVKLVEALSLA